jgi:hypothetical protein
MYAKMLCLAWPMAMPWSYGCLYNKCEVDLLGWPILYVSDEYRTDFSAVKYFSKIYFGWCGSEKVRVLSFYKLFIRYIEL